MFYLAISIAHLISSSVLYFISFSYLFLTYIPEISENGFSTSTIEAVIKLNMKLMASHWVHRSRKAIILPVFTHFLFHYWIHNFKKTYIIVSNSFCSDNIVFTSVFSNTHAIFFYRYDLARGHQATGLPKAIQSKISYHLRAI